MRPALLQPILIVLTCVFILFMLSGCVVAPYPEPVVYEAPRHHHYHGHRPHWRQHWRN
jgi:hypothetical protein